MVKLARATTAIVTFSILLAAAPTVSATDGFAGGARGFGLKVLACAVTECKQDCESGVGDIVACVDEFSGLMLDCLVWGNCPQPLGP